MTTSNRQKEERRNFPRYQPIDSSTVMLSPDSIISFKFLDISKSGLAFCYDGMGLRSKLKSKAIVDFFGEKAGATDIPVKIISDSDFDAQKVLKTPRKMPYLRRCGVKFGSLSDDQKAAINIYIRGLKKI